MTNTRSEDFLPSTPESWDAWHYLRGHGYTEAKIAAQLKKLGAVIGGSFEDLPELGIAVSIFPGEDDRKPPASRDITSYVLDHLVPEAWTPILEPSRLRGLERGVPASYVKLLQDAVIPPALQDEIIANLGTIDVAELDAGHDAMISRPKALAALLNELAGR